MFSKHLLCGRKRLTFQILSDLHLEAFQQYDQFTIHPIAPFLVLAGDIGRLVDYDMFLAFLSRHCKSFQRIFLVLGNHEFYGTSRAEGLLTAQRLAKEPCLNGRVSLLERCRYDVKETDVIILGCTLHSSIDTEKQDLIRYKIQDFQKIHDWKIEDHNAQHRQDVEWLQRQVGKIRAEKNGSRKRILVITHHAPTTHGSSAPELGNDALGSAFSTDIIGNPQFPALSVVQWWVFGHTHYTTSIKIGQVKIVSNQRGYVLPRAPYLRPNPTTLLQRMRHAWTRVFKRTKIFNPKKTITV